MSEMPIIVRIAYVSIPSMMNATIQMRIKTIVLQCMHFVHYRENENYVIETKYAHS